MIKIYSYGSGVKLITVSLVCILNQNYIRYTTRQKRAEAKKALKDLLLNSGSSRFSFQVNYSLVPFPEAWNNLRSLTACILIPLTSLYLLPASAPFYFMWLPSTLKSPHEITFEWLSLHSCRYYVHLSDCLVF